MDVSKNDWYLNKYVVGLFKVLITVLVLTIFLTLANYFNLLGSVALNILKILIPLISLLYGSYHIGKRSKERGWLEGLKIGSGISVIVVLFNMLGLDRGFGLKLVIFVGIIILISVLGSMLGITKVKEAD